jgi:hypothetical protein
LRAVLGCVWPALVALWITDAFDVCSASIVSSVCWRSRRLAYSADLRSPRATSSWILAFTPSSAFLIACVSRWCR